MVHAEGRAGGGGLRLIRWWRWLLAAAGLVLAWVLADTLGRALRLKMAQADEKKARAEQHRVRQKSEYYKHLEAKDQDKSERHLVRAEIASQRAAELEREAREIAEEASPQISDRELARRFNARHNLTPP